MSHNMGFLDQPAAEVAPRLLGCIFERIGIKRAADVRWRFYIKGNPYVSR